MSDTVTGGLINMASYSSVAVYEVEADPKTDDTDTPLCWAFRSRKAVFNI